MITNRVTVHALQECGEGKECSPSHTSIRTYHLYNGIITKEIIKECTCQGGVPENKCIRHERFTTYFEGSSFEQKIDTGMCVGSCGGFGLGNI